MSAHLEAVALPLGRLLHKGGDPIRHVYFPTDGIVSMVYFGKSGISAEIALIGREGLVGLPLVFGRDSFPYDAVVQCEGRGYRAPGRIVAEQFRHVGPLQDVVLRFALALMAQMAQTAVCNRHHSVEDHLCRWLLLSLDRTAGNELHMTQELIANMLGVRREGITQAAGALQAAGLIDHARGRIRVADRPGLEQRACECYGLLRGEFARLLAA